MSQNNSCILVLKGGWSSERDISLKTGRCVEQALDRLQINYKSIDVTDLQQLCEIDSSGAKYAFICLHGGIGEDGTVQSILNQKNIPFNGAGYLSSAIGMNKNFTKIIASSVGINIPKSLFITSTDTMPSYEHVKQHIGNVFVVKPNCQGCSIGVNLVENEDGFYKSIQDAFKYDHSILIEEYINGSEITVCQALPLILR